MPAAPMACPCPMTAPAALPAPPKQVQLDVALVCVSDDYFQGAHAGEWARFEIAYRHGTATYRVVVQNPKAVRRGIRQVIVDGRALEGDEILLVDDGPDDVLPDEPPSAVDEVGLRHSADPVAFPNVSGPVEHRRIGHAMAGKECARVARDVVPIHTDEDHSLRAVLLPRLLEHLRLALARHAPRGPEVDDDRFPSQRREIELARPVDATQRDLRAAEGQLEQLTARVRRHEDYLAKRQRLAEASQVSGIEAVDVVLTVVRDPERAGAEGDAARRPSRQALGLHAARCRVDLRDHTGRPTQQFVAGDVMEIHLWASGRAPEDSYTVEFKLHNS